MYRLFASGFGAGLQKRLALALLLLTFRTGAAVYFVACNGSDANFGTSLAAPFQTIERAASIMVAGDTCLIRGGVYRETLTPPVSGAAGAPITFAAYSNEVVTLNAGDLVTGWTLLSNKIYQASVDWDLGKGTNEIGGVLGEGYNQVFVDGVMAHEAQFPAYGNGDALHPATVALTVDDVNTNQITSAAWDGKPDNYWAGAWFRGGVGYSWSWQSGRVLSSTGAVITMDPTTEPINWWLTGAGAGFLWGKLQLLDADNEWYLQTNAAGNTLYLRVTGGGDPTLHTVEMKRRNWCVDFNGRNYITVRGLNVWGGAVRMNGNWCALQDCQGQFLSHFMTVVYGWLEDGAIEPGGGVVINGVSNTVCGCTIFNTAGSGVITGELGGASNTLITRNQVYNTDYSGTYAACIVLAGSHDVATFNTAHDSGREILRPEGAGSDIRFNDLYNPGLLCKDLGVIYNWGINGLAADGTPTRIAYNWCHDNYNAAYAPLIYFDNFDCSFVVDHNVCWDSGNGDAGIRNNGPAFNEYFYNNTLFNCADVGANDYDSWPDPNNPDPAFWTNDIYQYTAANNLYLANSPQTQLVDTTTEDFSLQPGAAAINAGRVIAGFTDGYAGAAPDLGAYEYGRPAWTAGVGSKPTLVIRSSGSGTVTLSTSPDAAYYQLFAATNLTIQNAWTRVTNAPLAQASLWTISLPAPGNGACYYRLQDR